MSRTTSGAGGSPVRSRWTRRTNVVADASADGLRPAASSRANMNRSIGLRAHAGRDTLGGCGRLIAWNDQCAALAAGEGFADGSGQGAPSSIQRSMAAILASGSFPSGGMLRVSDWSRAARTRLSEGRSTEIAGPRLPPSSRPSREASERPLVRSRSLWHWEQRVWRIGRISDSKKLIASAAEGACGAAQSDEAASAPIKPCDLKRMSPLPRVSTARAAG